LIIDSLDYKIEHLNTCTWHLDPFSNIEIVDLTPSIFWTKYTYKLKQLDYVDNFESLYKVYLAIGSLMFFLTSPISFPIFIILNYFHLINEIYEDGFSKCYYNFYYFISNSIFPKKLKPTITFIIPYIKFVNYPQDYEWWWELIKPKPSSFVEAINRSIYKTLNGEALINFKWNTYGKYYYFAIWMKFTALLGCYTAAATSSEGLLSDGIRRLLIASIILGFLHFTFELRQFIYDPIKWIFDAWHYFGKKFFFNFFIRPL